MFPIFLSHGWFMSNDNNPLLRRPPPAKPRGPAPQRTATRSARRPGCPAGCGASPANVAARSGCLATYWACLIYIVHVFLYNIYILYIYMWTMCIYICMYIHIYTYVYICIHMCIYMYKCIYIHIMVRMYVYIYIHIEVYGRCVCIWYIYNTYVYIMYGILVKCNAGYHKLHLVDDSSRAEYSK